MRRVAKKNTLSGTGIKFVASGGREVGIASATEHTKVFIGGYYFEEGEVRSRKMKGLGG
jgi:hypothetical protein